MVLNKHGETLYNGLKKLVIEHLNELAKEHVYPAFPINPGQQSNEGEVLLKALRKVWDDHTSSMTKIGQILKYMVSWTTFLSLNDFIHKFQPRTAFLSSLLKSRKRGILDSTFSSRRSLSLLFRTIWSQLSSIRFAMNERDLS